MGIWVFISFCELFFVGILKYYKEALFVVGLVGWVPFK